ncbi:MAG: hypothetical protein IJP03_00410 [Christensenellaceae bacterium]|nr:hypothetical protein [Christensenellaceae bacterium]
MLFPSAFFALLPFSEGLFLLLIMLFMRHLRRRNYLAAAIFGLLASLTRSVGVLLMAPFAIQVFMDVWQGRVDMPYIRRIFRVGWPIFLIPVGTLIYLGINYAVFGDALRFLQVQSSHWNQGMSVLPHTLWVLVQNLAGFAPEVNGWLWLPELICIFAMLGLLAMAAKRQNTTQTVYALVFFWFSISLTWLLSAPRYLLVMFPCFITLAEACKKPWQDALVTLVLGAALLVMACGFALGKTIY